MRGGHQKNKRDANEGIIFDILRAHGISVYPIDKPCDALCGYRGSSFLVEIKNGPKATLTTAQHKFIEKWDGDYTILDSEGAATRWCQDIRARYSWKPETEGV